MSDSRELSWCWLVPALVVPLLGSLLYFVWLPGGAIGQAAYTLTKLFTLGYPLLFLSRVGSGGLFRRGRRPQGEWPSWPAVAAVGLGSGLAISLLGAGLMLTPLGEQVRAGAGAVTEKATSMGFLEHYLLFAAFVSILHSALEEYYWRWFVYGQLQRKLGGWTAHLLAGLAFGAHHLVVTLQFFPPGLAVFLTSAVVLGGIIWSVIYERQGTLLGCWLSHLCVDVLLMGIGYVLITG